MAAMITKEQLLGGFQIFSNGIIISSQWFYGTSMNMACLMVSNANVSWPAKHEGRVNHG